MRTLLPVFVLLAWSGQAAAEESKWVGEMAYPKQPQYFLRSGPQDEPPKDWLAFGRGDATYIWDYPTVFAEHGEWLRFAGTPRDGWMKKSEVVRARDADAYFTERFQTTGSAWCLFARGCVRARSGGHKAAQADLDEALRRFPGQTLWRFERAFLHYRNDEMDAALRDLNEIIRREPTHAQAVRGRGLVYYCKGEFGKARAELNRSISLEPDKPHAYVSRGMLLEWRREFRKALAAYTEALRRDPLTVRHGLRGECSTAAFVTVLPRWRTRTSCFGSSPATPLPCICVAMPGNCFRVRSGPSWTILPP